MRGEVLRFNLRHAWLRWLVYRLPGWWLRWLVHDAYARLDCCDGMSVAELLDKEQHKGRWLRAFAILRMANMVLGESQGYRSLVETSVDEMLCRWGHARKDKRKS